MDKYKELSKKFRYCGYVGKCQSCEFYRETEPCSQNLLVEAADAIEELLNVKWHESCTDCPLYDKEKHRCPRFNAVIPTAIEDALNVSEKPTGWIPVSERLPEGDFLATTAWGDVTYASVSGGDSDIYIHEGNTNADWSDIIAWQPLPEPYKGEE